MRTFLIILVGILLFASLGFAFASFVANKALNDKELYLKHICTADFDDQVVKDAEKNIRNEGDQLALDYDKICELLDREAIVESAHSYTSSFVGAFLNGTKFDNSADYESDAIYDEIRRQILEIDGADEELTEEEIQEDIDTVYKYITDDVKAAVKYIPDYISNSIISLGRKVDRVKPYAGYGAWFLAASVLFTAALVFIAGCGGKRFRSGLIWAALPYWFASSAVFIPSLMFSVYDSASKITIAKSALYYVLSGILQTIEKLLLDPSAVFFAVSTIAVFVFAYFYVFADGKKAGDEPDAEKAAAE